MCQTQRWAMLASVIGLLLWVGASKGQPGVLPGQQPASTAEPLPSASSRCSMLEAEVDFGRRIGGTANPTESELFTQIVDVEFGPEARTYVLDAGEARVQVYDSDGRFLHRFGRRGGGPGEFRTPVALAADDSSVYVLDGRVGVHVFSVDGVYRRRIRIDTLPPFSGPVSIDVDDDVIYLGLVHRSLRDAAPEPPLHGVLALDTNDGAHRLFDSVSEEELQEGSYQNVPTLRRRVAAGGERIAVADDWHRDIHVFASDGQKSGTFQGCLPFDPNAEGTPETDRPGRIGGWGVTGDIDPLGNQRFARFVSYANPDRGVPQMIEVFDGRSLEGRAVVIPPAGDRWRRFTTAAVQGSRIVLANMFDGTVQWATLPSELSAALDDSAAP